MEPTPPLVSGLPPDSAVKSPKVTLSGFTPTGKHTVEKQSGDYVAELIHLEDKGVTLTPAARMSIRSARIG